MTSPVTQIARLKAGEDISFDADPAITPALRHPGPVRVRPFAADEKIKEGQIVLHTFAGTSRLRIVRTVDGMSCELATAHGKIEGWYLKSTIAGIADER